MLTRASPLCSQAVWYLKCRALTLKNWIDDTEIEEEVSPKMCPLVCLEANGCAGSSKRLTRPRAPRSLALLRRVWPRCCWMRTPPRRCRGRAPRWRGRTRRVRR